MNFPGFMLFLPRPSLGEIGQGTNPFQHLQPTLRRGVELSEVVGWMDGKPRGGCQSHVGYLNRKTGWWFKKHIFWNFQPENRGR